MLSRVGGRVIPAKGDGNCAFNAFLLRFCQAPVLNEVKLPDADFFVSRASEKLRLSKPYSWNALRIALQTQPADALRAALSPLLRELGNYVLHTDAEQFARHRATTRVAIEVELQQYFLQRKTHDADKINTSAVGEIFICHSFIRQQFEALYQASANDVVAAQTNLTTWWFAGGHANFLAEMVKSAQHAGQTHLYGGDLELVPIAAYFAVNMEVYYRASHTVYQLYHANGALPVKFAAVAGDLANRGVIYNPELEWKLTERDIIVARLAAVPQFDDVLAKWQALSHVPVRGEPLPPKWLIELSPACLAELHARGIVDATHQHFSGLAMAEVMTRITALADSAKILAVWDDPCRVAPSNLAAVAGELANRGVIYHPELAWKLTERDMMVARLAAIPQFDDVFAKWQALSHVPVQGELLPAKWLAELSPACLAELHARGIVDATHRHFSGLAAAEVMIRITALADSAKIMGAWNDTCRVAPTITLEKTGAHYNALAAAPVNAAIARAASIPRAASIASYSATKPEIDVNSAVSEAFDVLQRSSLSDKHVQQKFEGIFDNFSSVLGSYQKHQNFTLFKQAKEALIKGLETEIKAIEVSPLKATP